MKIPFFEQKKKSSENILPVEKSGKGVCYEAYKSSDGEIRHLMHNAPEHIVAFAPTRSGMSVSYFNDLAKTEVKPTEKSLGVLK